MILNSWFKAYTPRQGGSYRIGTGVLGSSPAGPISHYPTARLLEWCPSVSESLR